MAPLQHKDIEEVTWGQSSSQSTCFYHMLLSGLSLLGVKSFFTFVRFIAKPSYIFIFFSLSKLFKKLRFYCTALSYFFIGSFFKPRRQKMHLGRSLKINLKFCQQLMVICLDSNCTFTKRNLCSHLSLSVRWWGGNRFCVWDAGILFACESGSLCRRCWCSALNIEGELFQK